MGGGKAGRVGTVTFEYVAKDRNGREVSGSLQAASESDAAAQVRELGLYPLRLRAARRPSHAQSSESVFARVFPPVSLRQRVQFWAQLQAVLNSGMPMSEGLGTIAATGRGSLARIAAEASCRTAAGEPLSSVLAEYPSSIPATEVALIRAGEHAGTLPKAVEALASMNEAELATRRDFMFQLAYPAFVLLAIAFIPLLPIAVLQGPEAAARVVRDRYLPAVVVVAAVFIGARLLLALVPPIKLGWDHIKLKTPGIGGIVNKMSAARAADVLAAAYRSGIDLGLALELAADSCGNASMGRHLREAAPAVRAGEPITTALARTRAFPARALQMLGTGEKTGDIDTMMESASRYFNDEARSALRISAIAAGVVAILAAGLMTAMQVVGFYGSYATKLGGGGD